MSYPLFIMGIGALAPLDKSTFWYSRFWRLMWLGHIIRPKGQLIWKASMQSAMWLWRPQFDRIPRRTLQSSFPVDMGPEVWEHSSFAFDDFFGCKHATASGAARCEKRIRSLIGQLPRPPHQRAMRDAQRGALHVHGPRVPVVDQRGDGHSKRANLMFLVCSEQV